MATEKSTEPQPSGEEAIPTGLWGKINYIQTHVTDVAKSGWNDHHKFKFIQEHGIFEVLRPLLRATGLAVIPQPSHGQVEVDGNKTTVIGVITVVDPESGEREDFRFVGQGSDPQDKAAGKAQTNFVKYGLQKLFLIPTEAIDDTDQGADAAAAPANVSGQAPAQQPVVGEGAIGPEAAQPLVDKITAAVGAGQLDANKVTAKLATLRAEKVANLTIDGAALMEEWVAAEIAKSTSADG